MWDPQLPGVIRLPSGRLIRGRGLHGAGTAAVLPDWGLYLGPGSAIASWPHETLDWPDFRLPRDRPRARALLQEAWERAAIQCVEIGCRGGRGRTGTALACVAVLDGVLPQHAVAYVRATYDRRAVETPWQARFVRRFGDPAPD